MTCGRAHSWSVCVTSMSVDERTTNSNRWGPMVGRTGTAGSARFRDRVETLASRVLASPVSGRDDS